ncbi:hypothetical protein D7Y27_28000 [Corallococcus sp. AB004]|uniref:hypothetical protein n=1 Tax=Corallococcus TaxID=83461 RepID=UPI000EA211AC|nr:MULTISPECIES: hypothetical protein [Corallococcus]RKI36564.1 hypothetical protein D7Y27_28000 [Corallococcus sp. AB004]NPC74078.1 hypothetical protein [Corallococcus exiguus]NPD27999.1 hypothetical protein [Corallococcus exiguus]NRD48518.1 hypothetical protein [Corallococcus exiguus]RKH98257.1 hypothetical protein D7Y04_25260 [Corallococcus sp. AB038B]
MKILLKGRLVAAAFLCVTAMGCGEGAQSEDDALKVQEASATQCVDGFNGIRNCATGRATLKAGTKGIDVGGLDTARQDGFTSQFPRASAWRMEAAIGGIGEKGQGLFFTARDGTRVLSTLRIGLGGDKDQMVVEPTFPGRTGPVQYAAAVYSRGVLVAQGINFNNYDRFMRPWWWDFASYWYPANVGFSDRLQLDMDGTLVTSPGWSFYGGGSYGPFSVGAGSDLFQVEIDGKLVAGDRIDLIQLPAGMTSTPRGFTAVDVTAAATGFTLTGETTALAK